MNKRALIITVAVVILCLAGLLFWIYSKRQSALVVDSLPISSSTLPVVDARPIPTGDRISVTGSRGTVSIHNFLKEITPYGTTYITADTEQFSIAYQSELQKFLVTLYPSSTVDVNAFRDLAAESLAKTLDVPLPDLCSLNMSINVPDSYSSAFTEARYNDLILPVCASKQ